MQQPEISIAAARPSVLREPIIKLRMEEVAAELRQQKAATPATQKAKALPPDTITRCFSFLRFLAACVAGALHTLAPPTLAAAEATTVLLIYFLAVPNSVPTHGHSLAYSFAGSAEDVVLLSLLRCVAVTLAHSLGAGPRFQRPYLWTAAAFAVVSVPLGIMKLAVLQHSQWVHRQWLPFMALYTAHMGFALAQLLAAQRIARWSRKLWESGLAGYGFTWQEGEDTWLLAGHLQSQAEEGLAAQRPQMQQALDVPAQELADADSRWIECGSGLRVHSKLAMPLGQHSLQGATGVVLVHPFGGGTFSWRHIQQPLADACGLPVLSFDRPGFGLTDRPAVRDHAASEANPYTLKFQATLALQLASAVGLDRVILVGHGDGALLALMSAATSCREHGLNSPNHSTEPPLHGWDSTGPHASLRPSPPSASHALPMPGAAGRAGAVPPPRPRPSLGSLPDSLDYAWQSSMPEGGPHVLQMLLKGEWPASISGAGGSLLAHPSGARPPLGPQRSPLRQYSASRRYADMPGELGELQPCPEAEEMAAQQQQGKPRAGVECGSLWVHQEQQHQVQEQGGSSSSEAHGNLLPQESSMLVNNPSFLSETSDHEAWQAGRYSTQEAVLPHFLSALPEQSDDAEQYGQQEGEQAGILQPSLDPKQPSPDKAQVQQQQEQEAGEEARLGEELSGMELYENPSFLASESCKLEAALPGLPAVEEEADEGSGTAASGEDAGVGAPAAVQAAPGSGSLPGSMSEEDEGMWRIPEVSGVILLHPDLRGGVAPKYARVLAHSRLGRHVLRSLLRTEVGEVSNPRAWCEPQHLTPDLLSLYRRPLRVQGWDRALIEVARARNGMHSLERRLLLGAVAEARLPVLVATGEQDRLVPPRVVSRIAERLGAAAPRLAVMPRCGHLSHEEAPHVLLDFLAAFVADLHGGGSAG